MEIRELFKNSMHKKSFKEGELLFNEGDEGNFMYIVLEGEIEIVALRQVFETTGPGGIVGEMALISREPRTAAARAKTDGMVAVVDEKEFLYLVEKMPGFALEVMETLVRRLKEMDLKVN